MKAKQYLKQTESKKKRDIRTFILAAALITALLIGAAIVCIPSGTGGAAGAANTGWYYNGTDPYSISSADELAGLAALVNGGEDFTGKIITLTADIDLSDYSSGDGWTPIGNAALYPFNGTFDGENRLIRNLMIDDTTAAAYLGLFGYIGSDGTVENIGIAGSVTSSYNHSEVGGVAGYNNGKILNCYNAVYVGGTGDNIGGLAGYNGTDSEISCCYNTGTISNNKGAGGVVGYNDGGEISYCYNTGDVTGTGSVAGVVGNNEGGEISYCYNIGSVTNTSNSTGGVVGWNDGEISYCYNTGAVSGLSNTGGVVGTNNISNEISYCYNTGAVSGTSGVGGVLGRNEGTVTNCYSAGSVTGSSDVGGVSGYNTANGTVTNCYFNSVNYTINANGIGTNLGGVNNVFGRTTAEMTAATTLVTAGDLDLLDSVAFVKQEYNITTAPYSGCATSFYPELSAFVNATLPDGTDDIFTQVMSKISAVATSDDTEPLGYKEQYFVHGDGSADYPYLIYTPQQLNHVRNDVHLGTTEYYGLMMNINILGWNAVSTDSTPQKDGSGWGPIGVSTKQFTGTFDGNNHVIQNLMIDSSEDHIGLFGFIGTGGVVENLGIDGSVTGSGNYTGGVVGYNGGMISNCYNACKVEGSGNDTGGVVGGNESEISNCYNTGDITGGGNDTGGVAGGNNGTISNCYNMGTVDSSGNEVGGVVGYNNGAVLSCYNTGPVNGDGDNVGGVVGSNDSSPCTIKNCYNAGGVTGGIDSTGGVVGWNNGGEVSNCYYNSDVCSGLFSIGNGNAGDATGLTTAQMVSQSALTTMSLPSDFAKRAADTAFSYYPELSVFKNSTDPIVQATSKLSVEVNMPVPAVIGKSYYITATANGGSTILPGGMVSVQSGGSKTFTFYAQQGYYISSVIIDGKPLAQDLIDKGSYTFSSVNSNHTIEVFGTPGGKVADMILSITVNGNGKAEYSFDGGSTFATYASAAVIIPPSSNLVVRAVADDGSSFSKWQTPSGTETAPEISLGVVTNSFHLDLFFTDNGSGHHGGLYWALGVLLIILLILILWFILFGRRSYDVIKVGGSANIIGDDRVRRKKEYTFTVKGSGKVSYRVGEDGQWKALSPDSNGKYVIPKKETIGNITIEVR